MIYIFLIYIINVYIYTVSSVSKGVKRQCRIYVQPAGQTVSNPFGICGLNFSADGRQMTNRGPLADLSGVNVNCHEGSHFFLLKYFSNLLYSFLVRRMKLPC